MPEIRRATLADLDSLVPLFDAYRQFYRRPSDLALARTFLSERLGRGESIIFLALLDGQAVAFTQLYPTFSSGAAARILILNDLYVSPMARRQGVGAALLNAAVAFGRDHGAARLSLSTEVTNLSAQSLYEANGWTRDTAFLQYNLVP